MQTQTHLDHRIHIGGGQIALDYVVGTAHLRLQLIRGPGKEHLRMQRHYARHIAPRQQPLRQNSGPQNKPLSPPSKHC